MVEYSSDDEVRDLEVYVDSKGEMQHVAYMSAHEIYYNDDLLDLIHNELSLLKKGEKVIITRKEVDEDG